MSEPTGNNNTLSNSKKPSIRAAFTERRTYLRPINDEGTKFESPEQAMDRVISHQRWLWEEQIKRPLNEAEEDELSELRWYLSEKLISVSGRVKWMGGTDVIKQRASGAFNCSFTPVFTPADLVDVFWLLLQGCGVGFKPVPGLLTGLPGSINEIEFIGSTRQDKGGREHTKETINLEESTWTIQLGDSATGWAKALGMLTAEKPRVNKLIIDLSALRPGGKRLKGYGWISSGWEPLMKGLKGIVDVMQKRSDEKLTVIDIGDIVNHLGTVLSSRRSAQIWLHEASDFDIATDFETREFIAAKDERWEKGLGHREQSNNSIMFTDKPSKITIKSLLQKILNGGEPGFVNYKAMKARAPDAEGLNPCAEILLPPKGFCNLMQVVWHRFNGDFDGLKRAQYIAGRANYRQTCVTLRDGVLQLQWNDNQKLLRLCGVSPTGYVSWEYVNDPVKLRILRDSAALGAWSMADEFGLPRPRRVTQCQPSGCMVPETKIEMADGTYKSLTELFLESGFDYTISDEKEWMVPKNPLYVKDENNDVKQITSLYNNGYEYVYEIELDNGQIIKATKDHKFKLKIGQWKAAKDLTTDDEF